MRVGEAYGPGKFGLSFELFPPKTDKSERALYDNLTELMKFEPSYVTCTYGAGGTTRDKTLDVVANVKQRYQVSVAAHLTCVGSTVEQLLDYLRDAQQQGVENIVALRGDPPRGDSEFKPVPGGLSYANELVTLIRREIDQFGIAVAGYPEKHLESATLDLDLQNLKRKVDSGADVVITQLFYDNANFFHFCERANSLGIDVPIVPGILPVTNLAQIKRISSLCGAVLPDSFAADLESAGDDTDAQFEIGVAYAQQQVQELIDAGVPGVHFYVLNKSKATARILRTVVPTV
ncbi:MAG: methylenetetrahydrofolate reductase [NAD(P)H] [Pirellulales bacterium]|nr:methylenetetrahydrofolate reductase [NAD(P)H] [Pirellulales bacterium]